MAWDRVLPLSDPGRILVLTNSHLVDLAQRELPELPKENLFGEPKSCNTAPCIALAAAVCERRWGKDSVMVVMSADHYLGDEEGFQRVLEAAIHAAQREPCLVTLGVPPTRPETGYGYLECNRKVAEIPYGGSCPLSAFREKPSLETALEYLSSGRHLWNMGNFVWTCGSILGEFERQMPGLIARARQAAGEEAASLPKAVDDYYLNLPPEFCQSVDFAIMEKSVDIRVIPCRIPWDDVGSWAVLRRLRAESLDSSGNLSTIRHLPIDTTNTVVTGSEDPEGVVVTLGVDGLIIVRAGQRVLVASEAGIDQMRRVVEGLREKGWDRFL
jgi:mannose-1-phosphate guanylyltransferase